MDLFTYLMAKNGNNSSVHGDLFSYLLGKGQSQIYTVSGTTIYIPDAKKLVSFMMTKESTQETSILPNEYTQVDYIECDGGQYIDLNITANQNTNFNVQFKTLDSVIASRPFFGYLNDDNVNANDYFLYVSVTKKFQFGFNGYRNFEDVLTNTFYNVYNDKNKLYINGNEYTIPYSGDFSTSPNSLYLFKIRNVAANGTPIQLFSFKLFDNGTIVRDMIPCYRNSDNVVGLYDLVNDVFYTNQGTGAFTYGSVASIPNPDYPQEVNVVEGYRNLLNLSGFSTQTISGITLTKNSNNSISINGTSTSAITLDIPITDIELTTGKTYRIYQNNTFVGNNYAVSLRDSVKNIVDMSCSLDSATSSKTFTVSSNKIAKYFRIYIVTGKTINTTIYPMITESNVIFPYVPYGNNYIAVNVSDGTNTNKYPIPLNNNILAGIGDYKDELLVDKSGHCWLNKLTGKVVLDGTENWEGRPNYTYADRFLFGITTIPLQSVKCFSNYFKVENAVVTDFPTLILNNGQQLIINFSEKGTTTLSQFKAWLSTHNTEVYYALETPQLIDLNTTVDLKLFKGVNNITNSEDGYMTIEYR